MDDMTAFEHQIGTVLDRMSGPEPAFDAMAIANRAVTSTPTGRWSATARRLRGGTTIPMDGGFSMFSAVKFVAAGVIVALFGGFLLAGVLTTPQDGEMAPAAATESPTATATSEVVSDEPAPTTDTAERSPGPDAASPSPLVAGPGPWLTWERAPELDNSGDEFLERVYQRPLIVSHLPPLPEGGGGYRTFEQGGYALAFKDGDATRSDGHGPLDGYDPLRLWMMRPDGSIEKQVIDRAYKVEDVAIGPAGILIRTRKGAAHPDDRAGTLKQIGLRRADLAGPRYWLWRDGGGWSETEAPPENGRRDRVMATEDGYFVLGKDGRLHFSADLLEWDVIDELESRPDGQTSALEYIEDRLLYVSDDEIAWVGPDGLEPTPFGQAVGEAGPLQTLDSSYGYLPSGWGTLALLPWPGSEAGLVLIHAHTDSALFTPDGERWGLAPLAVPNDPAARYWVNFVKGFEVRDGQLVQYGRSDVDYMDGPWLAYRAVATEDRPG